ncbi:unnamed protein product [Lampetra fluviatilis]
MALTSPLGTMKATTIFILLLIGTAVADSAEVGNGSESGAQRQGRTPREFMVVTPEKMNAVAGSKIFLPCYYTCTISGVTHMLVEWFRKNGREEERLYKFPNGDGQWPLHATWMGDESKCDASITVSDIKTNDSGKYRCEVTVFPQNMQDIGYLQLNVNSPSELVVVTPNKMDAMAGSTFLLPCSYTCTISGVTTKLVEWLRIIDGREERIYQFSDGENIQWPLQATWVGNVSKCDASITVSGIQTHDSGQYRCEVTVYPQIKQDIGYLQLTVHPRTEFMVVTPEKMNAVTGRQIFLPCSYTCTISGVTHTLVEWYKMIDGHEERLYQYPNGDRQWPLHATWMGDVSKCDASITASDIKTNDSGQYRCEVTVFPQNIQDIGYLQLNVNSPSELVVVTPDKMDAMVGSTLILPCSYTCTISGVTTKLVEWFRIIDGREERIYQFSEGENRQWPLQATWVGNVSKCDASITVSDIQTHDSGRYRCEVSVYSQTVQYHIGYLQLTVLPRTDLVVVTPDAKDATVGSTSLLPCSYTCNITNIRHTLVEWFRTIDGHDEKVYKIIHRKRSLRPMQVTWVGDESTCNASITISNIQTHDAGRYRCEVTVYRYDKSSTEDIGYLQLNVHNESGLHYVLPGSI